MTALRVLITGASGYVAWAVVHGLHARGHRVVALVRASAPTFPQGVEARAGDLLSEAALRDAVSGVDAVVHLAARSSVRESVDQPTRTWRANVNGTVNLLDALRAESERTGTPSRLVFASTSAVYGNPGPEPIHELVPPAPLNPYGASKAAAERVIGAQVATGALGAVTLRIFNAAGAMAGRPDRDLSRIIPKVVAVAAGRAPVVTVNGDGGAIRDFVHVADLADAVARALSAVAPGQHRVYNLGAVAASVADILAATERFTGRPVPVEHRPANPNEARELRADTARIAAELGWAPRCVTLDELIVDQWRASTAE